MRNYNKEIGFYGEDIALNFLKKNNYKILDKNFICRSGEIDLISLKGEILNFVEVKSRFTNSFGNPKESVTCFKQSRIINAAKYYMHSKKLYNFYIRFDVIEVIFNKNYTDYSINFIENAFRS